jgi:pyruvate/2-oxoglutarate dehydrogenase complex dihydrolipoamide dehydrogenase (E3) component
LHPDQDDDRLGRGGSAGAPGRLTVDGADLVADKIFLATGLRTTIPAITGLEGVPYYTYRTTYRTLLDATDLPAHLLVVAEGVNTAAGGIHREIGT